MRIPVIKWDTLTDDVNVTVTLSDGSKWDGGVVYGPEGDRGTFYARDSRGFAKRCEELTNGDADRMAKDAEQR